MSNLKTNLIYTLPILLFLCPLSVIKGQKNPVRADSETLRLIHEAPEEKGKETGALIILKDYRMTIDEKGQSRLILRILGKVFTREAMLDYSQIPLGYNSFYEQPELNYARVIHSDGTIREVPKDAVQIKTTPESEGLQYTDSRYLSFALSGMEVGAAFDYQLTFTQKVPIIEGEWYDNHMFGYLLRNLSSPFVPRIDPTLTSKYTLFVPKGSKFTYHMYSSHSEPVKKSIGAQDEYIWVLTDLPSVKMEEGMPSLSKITPILVAGSVKSWSDIDKWASGKISASVEITDEIRKRATELVTGKYSELDKIKAISDFIRKDIQYIYADLDRGGYTPHPAGEILKSKYGDCKDKSILLIAMLKAVGIEAFPAMINPFPYDELCDIPLPLFTHMITFIPCAGKEIWLDMTSGVTPFPELFFPDQGRMAFIVDGKGGKLIRTPADDQNKNYSVFNLNASFSGGKVIISMKTDARGMQSDMLKSVFKELPQEMREQSFKAMIQSYANKAIFDTISFSDLTNSDVPFGVDIKYNLDSVWQKGQQQFTFGSHSLFALSLLGNVILGSSSGKRFNDLVEGYSFTISGSEKYEPPLKDLLPVSIPHNDSIKNEFFDFRQSFGKEGAAVVEKWSYSSHYETIPLAKYESFTKGLNSIKELVSWNLTFVDPMFYIPALLKSETSTKILASCNELLKADPKNILAFLIRGMVYTGAGQMDPAIRILQEAIDIDPHNKYAYLYIAYPLMAKKNQVLAVQNIETAIQLDNDFEQAYATRSIIYEGQKLYDKAIRDLDEILRIEPGNVFYLHRKSILLSNNGKKDESLKILEDALKADSSNVDICSVLAEAYLSQNLYNKAILLYYHAIDLDDTKASSYGNLGWAYYLAGNDQKSIEYSQKAVELDPVAYYAIYNLGLANLRSGNIVQARKIYGQVKGEESSVSDSVRRGAIKDLNDLKATGVNVREIRAILKDFFGM